MATISQTNTTQEVIDQGGNVFEWNEEVIFPTDRGLRGGHFNSGPTDMAASTRGTTTPEQENGVLGFRVASLVPEPSTATLLALALVGIGVRGSKARRASM